MQIEQNICVTLFVFALIKNQKQVSEVDGRSSITMVEFNLFEYEPPSATEEVARLRLRMNHQSLQELERKEIVTLSKDRDVVRKGNRFDETYNKIVGKPQIDDSIICTD